MREEAIIHRLEIASGGLCRAFQIPLPEDAEKIIGIEVGCQHAFTYPAIFPSPAPAFRCIRDFTIGELTLMHFGSEDILYSGFVKPHNHNLQFLQIADIHFGGMPYTHGSKAFEEKVDIPVRAALIKAHYRDRWSEMIGGMVSYELSVCIWIRKRTKYE